MSAVVGDRVRVTAGPDKGRRGAVTHVYESGVFAGLVVIEHRLAVEAADVRKERRRV